MTYVQGRPSVMKEIEKLQQRVYSLERRVRDSTPAKIKTFPPFVTVRRFGDLAVPANTTQLTIEWDSTFDEEGSDMWDIDNPTRITFRTEGVYLIVANLEWRQSTIDGTARLIIRRFPSAILIADDESRWSGTAADTAGSLNTNTIAVVYPMLVGDYIEASVYNSTTSNQTTYIQALGRVPRMSAFLLWSEK